MTARELTQLQAHATAAGQSVTDYVVRCVLPDQPPEDWWREECASAIDTFCEFPNPAEFSANAAQCHHARVAVGALTKLRDSLE